MNSSAPDMTWELLRVGKAFRIRAPFFSYEEIRMGNVNQTYKVNYIAEEDGLAKIRSYLVQKINTVAFTKPVELMQNIDKVTTCIRENDPGSVSLHFHHREDGTNYLMDADGFWRMSNYIPSVTFNTCTDEQIIRSTGEAFGEFQMSLSRFDADLLFYTIPDFHNTRKRYARLREDAERNEAGRLDEVRPELDWLLSVEDEACRLTDLYSEGKLPLRVTHNDTKINNVLFDKDTLRPLAVIDLDTVMPGLVGHDFGDAVRFAANFTEEDAEDTSKTGLDLNVFWAFAEGFLSKTAKTLTDTEIDTLGLSCFALACELATRFLDDYLNGDKYFKIRSEKHNLTRARCQIALAKDMQKKLGAMDAICAACAAKYR